MKKTASIKIVLFICLLTAGLNWIVYALNATKPLPKPAVVKPFTPPTVATSKESDINAILEKSWEFYKTEFMENNERVISNNYGGTISEGQSYALLKAVWMKDKDTFDKTWQWTKTNMKRKEDHLFGWRWGKKEGSTSGLIETENATDADQDIAYALLLAGERWGNPKYINEAKKIINDIWQKNVVEGHDRYYLTAGTWAGFYQDGVTLNPSYFAPYVYRKFAEYDNRHNWHKLADDIYPVLTQCSELRHDKMPPNFCKMNIESGDAFFSFYQDEELQDFGYDATRVFWRMTMDALLNNSTEAKAYLAKKEPYLLKKAKELQTSDTHLDQYLTGSILATQATLHPEREDEFFKNFQNNYHNLDEESYWFNDYDDYLHSVLWLHLYSTKSTY